MNLIREGHLYDTGKEKWRYEQACDYRNGIPNRRLLGPCPRCGSATSTYGGGFNCHNEYCINSAMVFACQTADIEPTWWNTDINVNLDGDMWCAFRDGFTNLQESLAGFGKTPNEAVNNLIEQEQV